ncbi:MAG TPA: hypothetical protein VEU62_21840 [Bryobacterales bacterium]|nr:hypothetical protein [Bryobacterales bacterium]
MTQKTAWFLMSRLYRYNNRHLTDAGRFSSAIEGAMRKRVTWDHLTGSVSDRSQRSCEIFTNVFNSLAEFGNL